MYICNAGIYIYINNEIRTHFFSVLTGFCLIVTLKKEKKA